MATASLISILIWSVLFMSGTKRVLAQDECNVNADCNNVLKFCCEGLSLTNIRRKTCQFFSCLGRHCVQDGDCGGKGECCNSQHQCVTIGCPECQSDSDCATSEYCCKQRFISDHNVCRRSCVGETCLSFNDCGVGECCIFNKCTTTGCSQCSSHPDCPASQYCCKRGSLANVCRQSCIGETCQSSSDCGAGECCIFNKCTTIGCSQCVLNSDCPASQYCCFRGLLSNMCRQSCVGEICFSSIGCGGPGEHCSANSLCTKSNDSTTFAGWAIAIVVTGVILLIVLIVGGVLLCCRHSKSSQPGQQTPANPPVALLPRFQFPKPSAPPLPTEPAELPQPVSNPLQNPLQILNNNPGRNGLRSQMQDILSEGISESLQNLDISTLPDITGVAELFGGLQM